MNYEVYLHGQILGTHSFLLKGDFLKPDEYSELKAKYFLPGGETGTAATVLASLGVNVRMDGTHIGTQVAPLLKDFYRDKTVDLSSLFFDPEYEGLMDYVVIAGLVRSPMGVFQSLYEEGAVKRWNMPKEEDIIHCKAAAIDPFFLEETQIAAELCVKHHKPYVTIDCCHDSYLHQHCAVNVVSKECTHSEQYKDKSEDEIYKLLTDTTDGLVIITRGEQEMLYGRKGQAMRKMQPFSVDVKSTLGAGDTFKAGCVYGLLHHMPDDELVRFASACSAIAISRFPLPLHPPTMEEVRALLNGSLSMNVFDESELDAQRRAYAQEAKEKWGSTDAYREHEEKTKGYSAETWDSVMDGMDALMAEFAACRKNGNAPDSDAAQALVKQWQDYITAHFYTCTKEILAGLGEMYAADERFAANIDRHGDGMAVFMCEAIRVYCG